MNDLKHQRELDDRSTKSKRRRYGGAPANALFIPVVVVLAALNIIVIALMLSIFSQSSRLSQFTQDSSSYINDATSLLAGASVLSETSSNFILLPINSKGELNVGPLNAYANEMLQTDRRGDQVLARFETYNVSDEVHHMITEAATASNTLVDLQTHAIALVSSVYPLPDTPPLAALELPELTDEEAALSDAEKIELAQKLVLDDTWGNNKSAVSSNVNAVAGSIRASTGEQAAVIAQQIGTIRTWLIVVSVLIVVFLAFSFFMFYRLLISPLGRYARLIDEEKALDDKRGLREMRVLAGSYNELSHKRDALEALLREAAETDTLTGLPNRYSLQQRRIEADDEGYSLAVFLFDLDNLKQTNDKFGHAAGDKLIRCAAQCIAECFTAEGRGQCYRMAGDEFAVVIKNFDENKLEGITKKFEAMQAQNNLSISWGYAYTKEISSTTFRTLMDKADQSMYKMKEEHHRNGSSRDAVSE